MSEPMSQREARQWKKRALAAEAALKDRFGAIEALHNFGPWSAGAKHVVRLTLEGEYLGRASMAEALGCVLVVRRDGVYWSLYAVPQIPTRVEGGAA